MSFPARFAFLRMATFCFLFIGAIYIICSAKTIRGEIREWVLPRATEHKNDEEGAKITLRASVILKGIPRAESADKNQSPAQDRSCNAPRAPNSLSPVFRDCTKDK